MTPLAGWADGLSGGNETAQLSEGRRVYDRYCYFCHGYSGNAQTTAAEFLDPQPRNFKTLNASSISREAMLLTVRQGRTDTAMAAFEDRLSNHQIEQVVAYIRHTFMLEKAQQPGYHTASNGWADHQKYRAAFPFARGELSIDDPTVNDDLTLVHARRLFMSLCISCHEPKVTHGSDKSTWQIRPVTYPPDYYLLAEWGRVPPDPRFDPHHRHEHAPQDTNLTVAERRGKELYARNCATCHAMNGSSRNWRGSFLQPAPPDLRSLDWHGTTDVELVERILDAPAGKSMPAFRSVLTREETVWIISYIRRVLVRNRYTQSRKP